MQEHNYAVAVRDGDDLYLHIDITRSQEGNVYTNIVVADDEWKPHGSWHTSGVCHQKAYNKAFARSKRQKPDASFKGTHNLTALAIEPDYARALNVKWDPSEYSEVMEVPIEKLKPLPNPTNISIDLSEPGGQPIVAGPSSVILERWELRDAVPWILVTLFDTG